MSCVLVDIGWPTGDYSRAASNIPKLTPISITLGYASELAPTNFATPHGSQAVKAHRGDFDGRGVRGV
jgi:hypothetical protein